MLSVKTRLKIQSIKKKLIKTWYTLMKPIAYMIIKYEKLHSHIYNNKMRKVEQWSNEYVIKLYAKEFIKNIVRYGEIECCFVVADSSNNGYGDEHTILGAMENSKNNSIQHWIYAKKRLLKGNLDLIRTLTDLLKMEVDKCDNLETDYIIKDELKNDWEIQGYEKTLVIKLNMNK